MVHGEPVQVSDGNDGTEIEWRDEPTERNHKRLKRTNSLERRAYQSVGASSCYICYRARGYVCCSPPRRQCLQCSSLTHLVPVLIILDTTSHRHGHSRNHGGPYPLRSRHGRQAFHRKSLRVPIVYPPMLTVFLSPLCSAAEHGRNVLPNFWKGRRVLTQTFGYRRGSIRVPYCHQVRA